MKRFLSAFLAGLIPIAAASIFVAASVADANACVRISRPADLNKMRNNLAGEFCLTEDIDLRRVQNFAPIGDEATPFTGTLDGRGHVIRNLTIVSDAEHVGFFGWIQGPDAAVRNLGLANVFIASSSDATDYIAPLAAVLVLGEVENSFATGRVVGAREGVYAGGLVSVMEDAAIEGSHSQASVRVAANGYVGGLVAVAEGGSRIVRSYATGAVTGGDNAYAGGLISVGLQGTTLSRSFARNRVSVGDGGYAGGLAAVHFGRVSNVLANGAVRGGVDAYVGGLIAVMLESSVNDPASLAASCADGRVGAGASSNVGGLIAVAEAEVSIGDSYWSIPGTGTAQSAAGEGLRRPELNNLPPGLNRNLWTVRGDGRCPALR